MSFYIVDGWRDGRIAGQWVIKAEDADEARLKAERAAAGVMNYDEFTAELTAPGEFEAEENLTEEIVGRCGYCLVEGHAADDCPEQ